MRISFFGADRKEKKWTRRKNPKGLMLNGLALVDLELKFVRFQYLELLNVNEL
jgi:hypothetical protein